MVLRHESAIAITSASPSATTEASNHGPKAFMAFVNMYQAYSPVTDFSRAIPLEALVINHNLRMLFLIFCVAAYSLIHLGAKRAVENYDGSYGNQDTHRSGLKSAPVRIPSNFL
ncbi:MAG: hypothetical protein EBU66_12365 [Bacteroidetes bacterium]|nr:hypothetical protein [bacterium]NBP65438.1 hypothetical protein [Bacteroidota bacterium]